MASGATRVQARVAVEVTSPAGDFQVLTFVLIPVLGVPIPRATLKGPTRTGIVALSTVVVTPFAVTRHVTVGADVVEPLKVGILVTLEACRLGVLAR